MIGHKAVAGCSPMPGRSVVKKLTTTEWHRRIATGFIPCHYPHFFGRESVISRSGTRKSSDANVLALTQGFDFAQR